MLRTSLVQLPQRNSASATHAFPSWLTDRAIDRTPQMLNTLSLLHTCGWIAE